MSETTAIVLAAGKGTRMEGDLPKVLFPVCGRPMIHFVLDALEKAGIDRTIVVVGYRADLVKAELADRQNLSFVEQTEQLGTGHAVKVCTGELTGHSGPVMIVTGDSPMLQVESAQALLDLAKSEQPAAVLGTLNKANPQGLGRIVRDSEGAFTGIVEERDATEEERKITEVNMSTYVFDCGELLTALALMRNDNRQGEYYITDCPGILRGQGKDVRALPVLKPCEALSINTVEELAIVDAEMRKMGYPCAT